MSNPRNTAFLIATVALAWLAMEPPAIAQKAKLVYARDGSGVFGYKDTPVQPWSGFRVHDPDRPLEKKASSEVKR